MTISKRSQEWLRWAQVTSIPLRHIDESGQPIGFASGCLILCAGRKFILSARHAVQPESKGWAIELGFDSKKGTEMFWPKAFSYMAEMQKGSGILNHLDFCFAEVAIDVESTYAHRTPDLVSDERARHIFGIEDFVEPNQTGTFAFAGEIKPQKRKPGYTFNSVANESGPCFSGLILPAKANVPV